MYLREGGYFIFTTFDGDLIKEKLKNNDKYTEYYDDNGTKKLLFEIKRNYDPETKNNIGLGIDVHMAWLFEEDVYRTEYLVLPNFIINSLKARCQLELVETGSFETMFNNNREFLELSSNIEEDVKRIKFFRDVYKYYIPTEINKKCYGYTFLNKYYIFRKKENNLMENKKKYYSTFYEKKKIASKINKNAI
jgi:hypothetical protein